MDHWSRLFLLPLLGCLLAGPAGAGWLPTNGPGGKGVNGLAVDGPRLVTLTDEGLYRSGNRGEAWERIPAPSEPGLRTSLAVRDGEAYLGTFEGVFRRASENSAWIRTASLEDATVQALAFAGSSILAGTGRLGHLYRSRDAGATWVRLNPEVRMGAMLHLAADGTRLFAATAEGIFLSPDDGATWSRRLPDPGDYEVRTIAWNDRWLFARTENHIYRSADSGAKWSRITPPGLPTAYPGWSAFAVIGSRLHATSLALGLFRSEDHGATWTRDSSFFNITVTGSNHLFAVLGEDLFAGGVRGIYRSGDRGLTWAGANTGIGGVPIYHLTGLGSGGILAAKGEGYYRTGNHGGTWTHCPPGKPGRNTGSFARLGSLLFTRARSEGLYRSRDGGLSWDTLPGEWDLREGGYVEETAGALFLQVEGVGMLCSRDTGATWKAQGGLRDVRARELAAGPGGRIFAATDYGLYALDGDAWTPVTGGLREWRLTALEASGPVLFAASLEGEFRRSADGGATWTAPLDSSLTGQVYEILAEGEAVFVGADSGVFLSRDRGMRWSALDSVGRPARGPVSALLVQDDTLFAAFRTEGVWKIGLDPSTLRTLGPRRSSPDAARPGPIRSGPGRMGFHREDGNRGSYDAGGKRLP